MSRLAKEQVEALVQRFVSDLMRVVQDAAVRAFTSAFEFEQGGDGGTATTPPRHRGGGARGGASTKTVAARRRVTGGKRDPKHLAALTEKLAAHVKANAGQNILTIGAALGASTADLALPTKKLLAAKRIKKRGTRASTRYYPAK